MSSQQWVGRTIGAYQIESLIARGGVATVYRARQPQLERWVALKALTVGAGDDDFISGFRREAKAVAALRHPNIVAVYDYGEENGLAYIVMEYVPGGTLDDIMMARPMAWTDAMALILPIAQALEYAHSQGIVHCDVKPANILMAQRDRPLLTDFGLVRLASRGLDGAARGILSGTPAYISPEQVTGEPIDRRSDIYSLGIILYELVTGQLPFMRQNPGDQLMERLHEVPPLPSRYNDGLSSQMDRAILKAVARDPAERYRDASSLIATLTEMQDTVPLRKSTTEEEMVLVKGTGDLRPHPEIKGPHLIVIGTETVLPIPDQGHMLVGRADRRAVKQPDVDLAPYGGFEAGVSRYHARLVRISSGWLLEDLNSTNGTHLNSTQVMPGNFEPLANGDVIRFGRMMLAFFET